jgi:two-component system, NtrC family, nitrogen regulation response regulator GlnG
MIGGAPETREKSPRNVGKLPPAILVVDDEALTCWSIAEVLGERGYTVKKAADAASALQVIASDPAPDLVFLDVELPDSNDLAVLSVIHRTFPRMPVVVMTGYGSPALTAEARRRGAVAVVDKPFDMDVLPPMVAGILARSQA